MKTDNENGKVKTRRHRTAERKGSLELHNGKWRIVALVNGEKIRKSTGTANREEAERIQREYMAQFTARDAVAQAAKLADAVKTAEDRAEAAAKRAEDALPALRLSDAVDVYLNDFTRLSVQPTTEGTDDNCRQYMGQLCKWVEQNHPECVEMRHFTAGMAEEYGEYLRGRVAPSTCSIRLSTIRRVWRVLADKAKCTDDPWAKIRARQGGGHRRENFTPEQIEAIFSKLTPGTELHALCTVGLYTGLRLGDAAMLKWTAVDFKADMIELLPIKVKKYGKYVRIPIHETLRSVLEALPRKGQYVLPEMARLYQRGKTYLGSRVSRLFRSAGIETNEKVDGYAFRVCKYGFHSFRHSFVSMCAEQGIPLSVVQELVGHLSPDMTSHYFHLSDPAARRAIAMLPGAGETTMVDTSKVNAAVDTLAGLNKEELRAVREKLDALLAK